MFGLDAGINRNIPEFLFKFLVAHPVQRRAGDRARLIGQDAELTGNRHRGIDMVAGNHDRADAGLAAFLDCSLDLGTNRVDHTGKADKNEFLFQLRRAAVRGYRIPEAEAGRQHAQRPVGHGLVRREDFSALCLGHGFDLTVFQIPGAELEHFVRCALGILDNPAAGLVDGTHHLTHGVERSLSDTRLGCLQRGLAEPEAVRIVDQRAFGRFADRGPFILLRVGAEAHGSCQEFFIVAIVVDNRHFVLRQGAGFVRTDDLRTAQCLYGGQPADNGIALGHIGHTDAEHDSDHGCKPLRDRGDSQRYRNHE